jgi:hypothetical protein
MTAKDRMLTREEFSALPAGAVVDATDGTLRDRVMRVVGFPGSPPRWVACSSTNGRLVEPGDLADVVLITDAPIRPVAAPIPTTPGTWFTATVDGHVDCKVMVTDQGQPSSPECAAYIVVTPSGMIGQWVPGREIDPSSVRLIEWTEVHL